MTTSPSSSSSSSDVTIAGPSNMKTHIDLHHTSPEIIVIGAGIAGSALAYALSHSGRSTLLIERDLSEPDRIVGELLQPGGVKALSQLGLAGVLEGIDAVPVEGYCVVSGGRRVEIPYPELDQVGDDGIALSAGPEKAQWEKENGHSISEKGKATNGSAPPWYVPSASGRKEGRSFHHGRVISSLRQRCLYDAHNLTVVEGTVRQLVRCEHTNRVIGISAAFKLAPKPDQEEQETIVRNIYAPITIIADGCFSKFRSQPGLKLPTPETRSHFVGVVLKDVDLPIPRHGTVCLTPEGPVLLYQIGDKGRETRMLVDVKGKLPSVADGSLKNYILDLYVPHLPLEVQPAVRSALESQRLRTMPNSFLPPTQQGKSSADSLRGAIMIGDSWNMRHPLTGGGMTVAFNDAVLLTELLRPSEEMPAGREGLEWEKVAPRLRAWFWERKKLASVVNILSVALYDLFGGADADLAVLREGCFRYFELGGECVAGPVSLLSAIAPAPLVLAYHFFSVAFYSIYILFVHGVPPQQGQPSKAPGVLEWPYTTYLAFRVFYTACVVFLPLIWTEIRP